MSDAGMQYNVGATWQSNDPIQDEVLAVLGSELQPDDESFCFWIDAKNPRRLIATWDVRASSVEEAGRLCYAAVADLSQSNSFAPELVEIGVSTDEGYWVLSDPGPDLLS